jgi:IS4 transposase
LFDGKTGNRIVLLTNNFALPALAIAEPYRSRRPMELFFKWIKQHLRIKVFFGTTGIAVKARKWIAITAYVLVSPILSSFSACSDTLLSDTLLDYIPHTR